MTNDLGFRDTDRVDALADDLDGNRQGVGVVVALGFEGDRGSALQVEAEGRAVAGDEVRRHRGDRDEDDSDEGEEKAAAHWARLLLVVAVVFVTGRGFCNRCRRGVDAP